MKIRIEGDRLVARRFGHEKFSVSPNEIVELRFWAAHKYYGPKLLVWLIGSEPLLRAVIVWTGKQGITLENRDSGSEEALHWFGKNGWDIDEGKRRAFETPLVRTTVPRTGLSHGAR
jgi:hypothetical protein